MSIYKGTQLISGVATPIEPTRNIGQIIQSLLPITDAGLHLLDGTVISGDGIYSSFVNYISQLDLTASYFTTEADWQTSVEQYGVCGKFVYNASANTVRLPKVTGILEGTIDPSALGDLVEAGVPNIIGNFPTDYNGSSALKEPTGVFVVQSSNQKGSNDGGSKSMDISFDASRSSSVYGKSNTVQPQTIKGYYYIVVATGTKTDIEVDIDNIVTDLNNKVDISNMVEVPTIVESYVNNTSGYNLYSTGYCEQWGYIRKTSNPTTVTILKEYKDTEYQVFTQCLKDGNGFLSEYETYIGNRTTKSFGITAGSSSKNGTNTEGMNMWWRTYGYIAKGD